MSPLDETFTMIFLLLGMLTYCVLLVMLTRSIGLFLLRCWRWWRWVLEMTR